MAMRERPDLPEATREWLYAVLNRLQMQDGLSKDERRNPEIAELREQLAAMRTDSG